MKLNFISNFMLIKFNVYLRYDNEIKIIEN